MSQTSSPWATAAARPVLTYDGRLLELFGIFLLNLLLTIVTFGIFRFWAITRIRRYLWSHMRFEGSRLSYTGRGGELFLGFLMAIAILILFIAVIGLMTLGLAQFDPGLAVIPGVLTYVGLFVLFGAARYSAQRYRLSRTEWRGIRGGMTGSAWRYGFLCLLYIVSLVMTLYQSLPWMQVGLARQRINASRFGSAAFRCGGRAGPLYPSWLLATLGNLVLLGLIFAAVAAAAGWPNLEAIMQGGTSGPDAQIAIRRMIPAGILGILVFGVISSLLVTWYWVRLIRMITGRTVMTVPAAAGSIEPPPGELRFRSTITGGGLIWLIVSNGLLVAVTLGLGLPIVLHRSARFLARTTWMTGTFNADALAQSELARPRTGEGLLQAFDPGIV